MARKDPEAERKYQREYQRKVRAAHPGLAAERSRKFRAKNPEYARDFKRRADMLPQPSHPQTERCECCGEIPQRTMHLDHDHVTGEFRGWLCGSCNMGIGSLGDDVAGLMKALKYLTRTP